VDYDLLLKKKGFLSHAAMWVNLKDIMLSETRPSQRTPSVWVPLCEEAKPDEPTETERRMEVARGQGGAKKEPSFSVSEFPF
jgi:hypothetical protein